MFNSEVEENVVSGDMSQYTAIDSSSLKIVSATVDELTAHETIMDLLDKKSEGAIWRR